MSRNRRRTAAVAIVGALSVAPMVSACAAGQRPQSTLATQLVEGANASVHKVAVRNVFVLGPEPGGRLAVGGSAPVYAWIVNNGTSPDRLVAVNAPDAATSVEIAGGGLALPPGELVSMNAPAPLPTVSPEPTHGVPTKTPPTPGPKKTTTTAPSAVPSVTPGAQPSALLLKGLKKELTGSETLRLTFHFQRAGAVTLTVPVPVRQGSYSTYSPASPAAASSASATPAASPSRTGKAKKASPSPAA